MLRSGLCDYSDAYVVLKWRISVTGTNNTNKGNKQLTFKNNAPFKTYITKISNTFIHNPEDLDIIMPMCNLQEYSDSYSITSKVCGIIIEMK